MSLYQRIRLRDGASVGEAGPLPADVAAAGLGDVELERAGETLAAWRGYGFVAATLDELKARRIEAVRVKRAEIENAGIVRNGAPIKTDERTQNRVANALKLFEAAPQLEAVDWEAAAGVFVTLDGASLAAIGVEIGLHIQACFSHSRDLCGAIAAAEDEAAVLAVDIETGWPS